MSLVVVGLLISGVSGGRILYHQAKLTSTLEDITQYISSFNSFKAKYGQNPGDFNGAFTYWGSKCADITAHCNGDGNGTIDQINNEPNKAWKHLQLAGMVPNDFAVLNGNTTTLVGVNAPNSKFKDGGLGLPLKVKRICNSNNT